MRSVKKITLSAMAVALGVTFMTVGAIWEPIDMSAAALASLLVVLILIEVGKSYAALTWLATSLITFIFFTGSTVWLMYFTFGVFPILKYFIEKLPRPFWLILKIVYVNICIILLAIACELIFGLPLFDSDSPIFKAVLYVILNIAFLMAHVKYQILPLAPKNAATVQ